MHTTSFEEPRLLQGVHCANGCFHGIVAVLSQRDEDKADRPITYYSKKLHTSMREALNNNREENASH